MKTIYKHNNYEFEINFKPFYMANYHHIDFYAISSNFDDFTNTGYRSVFVPANEWGENFPYDGKEAYNNLFNYMKKVFLADGVDIDIAKSFQASLF